MRRFPIRGIALPVAFLLLAVLTGQAGAASQAAWKTLTPAPSPALALPDLEGKTRDLAALKGKVVLVHFWASYCKPCRAEAPSLSRLARRLKQSGLEVLGVNVAEGVPEIQGFIASTGMAIPIVLDQDATTIRRWRAIAMPTTFLVDRQGQVRARITGEADWDAAEMAQYLAPFLNGQ
jgi:cytochrome c biogenesis protein CcmG/thiol:disulfide interchange protein DsbE